MRYPALLLLLVPALALGHAFTKCSKHPVDYLGVTAVEFSPDPPQAGKPVSVTVQGVTARALDSGTIKVEIRVMGITVSTETFELCAVLECPLAQGQAYKGSISQEIPSATPDHMSATVRVSVSAHDETLSCLESSVSIQNEALLAKAEHNRAAQFAHVAEFLYARWRLQWPQAHAGTQSVFLHNVQKVFAHNSIPAVSFQMALNEFAAMTEHEFVDTRMGLRLPEHPAPLHKEHDHVLRGSVALADPPAELDWVARGAVTGVKNQGACGSCWAFSAVAAIESAYFLKSGLLAEFSEQELVSCDDGDYGCQGGLMDTAFDWVQRQGGLCGEEAYPYTSGTTSARGTCMSGQCNLVPGSVPKGFIDVAPSESALLAALTEHGPVAVAIEADQSVFQFYHSGVLTGACGTHLNHGVLLVGFGTDAVSGMNFWKVKNSWGTTWGEEGFVRMQRGKRWPAGGECGIASKASFPIL